MNYVGLKCTHKISGSASMNISGEVVCGKPCEYFVWYEEAQMGYGYLCKEHLVEYLQEPDITITVVRRVRKDEPYRPWGNFVITED